MKLLGYKSPVYVVAGFSKLSLFMPRQVPNRLPDPKKPLFFLALDKFWEKMK